MKLLFKSSIKPVLAGLCLVSQVAFAQANPPAATAPAAAPKATASLPQSQIIRQGEYVATAADCAACHTTKGGAAFAGGYSIQSPMGVIWATNITPSKQYGIGHYTEAQFSRAIREGVTPDGHRLYPAMPYTAYARMTDED